VNFVAVGNRKITVDTASEVEVLEDELVIPVSVLPIVLLTDRGFHVLHGLDLKIVHTETVAVWRGQITSSVADLRAGRAFGTEAVSVELPAHIAWEVRVFRWIVVAIEVRCCHESLLSWV
jgi:hypothetical protein